VAWGISCVLVFALWVRSCRYYDWIDGYFLADTFPTPEGWHGTRGITLRSWKGVASFRLTDGMQPNDRVFPNWEHRIENDDRISREPPWYFLHLPDWLEVNVPHGFLVAILASVACAPWLPKLTLRFSLRTLLIATTVIAAILGIIAISH
jgi:hypothetical protein